MQSYLCMLFLSVSKRSMREMKNTHKRERQGVLAKGNANARVRVVNKERERETGRDELLNQDGRSEIDVE